MKTRLLFYLLVFTSCFSAKNIKAQNTPAAVKKRLAVVSSSTVPSGLHLLLKDSSSSDNCGIYFKPGWSDIYDTNDAFDLDSATQQVALSSYTSDKVLTSVNALSDYTMGKRVKLYIKGTTDTIYTLSLTDITGIDTTDYNVYLVDRYKKDSLDLVRYGTYNFNIYNGDSESYGGNRFVLAVERKPLAQYQFVRLTAVKVDNGVQLTWKSYNDGDYTTFTLEKQENGVYTPLYSKQSDGSGSYIYTDTNPYNGANVYRIKQDDIDDKITYSPSVSISYNSAGNGMFSVYPNPARNAVTINMNVSTTTAGPALYQMSIFNAVGVMVLQASVTNNNLTQDITQLKPGYYTIALKSANGTDVGRYKFLKVQ